MDAKEKNRAKNKYYKARVSERNKRKEKELVRLQESIHSYNAELGWWDNHRSPSTFANLFISELSEAMEGERKGLMDDHLPDYEMFWVELADYCIRVMDWLGHYGNTKYYPDAMPLSLDRMDVLFKLTSAVTEAFNSMTNHPSYAAYAELSASVCVALNYAEAKGVDLLAIIKEKVEYNKQRADHKRQNRAAENGKKF